MSICIHQVLYPMYLPAPPALKSTQASRMNWKERTEPTTTYNLYLGLGLGVLQEPGVQPQPIPQPSPHTHTHTHTRGNKSLIPLSTFHFLYSTGIYLLPGTSMYTQYSSKNPKYAWTIHHTLPLPTSLDHRSSLQAVCERFAQLPCRDDIPSCKSVHLHHHHHQTRIRVRRGVPFPTMYM